MKKEEYQYEKRYLRKEEKRILLKQKMEEEQMKNEKVEMVKKLLERKAEKR